MNSELIEDLQAVRRLLISQEYSEDADVVQEAISALEAVPVWVKCSDRAPEDERDVVICNMNCTNTYSYPYEPSESLRLAFGGGLAGWHDAETGEVIPANELTHWIDVGLPAPPKVEQEGV